EVVVDVVLHGVRQDALVHERTDGLLDQLLLRAQREIHGRQESNPVLLIDRSVNFCGGIAMAVTVDESVVTGLSFALTDEQRELRSLAREFAEKEIRPKAAEYDENQTHPVDVIAKAHDLGLMNPHIPEEYGGLGLSVLEGVLI